MQTSVISHLWKNTQFKVDKIIISPGTKGPDCCKLTIVVFSKKANRKMWYEAEFTNKIIFDGEFEEKVSPAGMILEEIALWEKKLMEVTQNVQSPERSHE